MQRLEVVDRRRQDLAHAGRVAVRDHQAGRVDDGGVEHVVGVGAGLDDGRQAGVGTERVGRVAARRHHVEHAVR